MHIRVMRWSAHETVTRHSVSAGLARFGPLFVLHLYLVVSSWTDQGPISWVTLPAPAACKTGRCSPLRYWVPDEWCYGSCVFDKERRVSTSWRVRRLPNWGRTAVGVGCLSLAKFRFWSMSHFSLRFIRCFPAYSLQQFLFIFRGQRRQALFFSVFPIFSYLKLILSWLWLLLRLIPLSESLGAALFTLLLQVTRKVYDGVVTDG